MYLYQLHPAAAAAATSITAAAAACVIVSTWMQIKANSQSQVKCPPTTEHVNTYMNAMYCRAAEAHHKHEHGRHSDQVQPTAYTWPASQDGDSPQHNRRGLGQEDFWRLLVKHHREELALFSARFRGLDEVFAGRRLFLRTR